MRKRIFFISLSIVTFIGILSLIGYILPYKPEGELTTLDGPWDIDTVDVHIKDASVDEVSEVLSSLHERDMITLSCELPDDESVSMPTILLTTRYSAIEVSCGTVRVFSMWMDRYNEHKFVGGGRFFIPVPIKPDDNRIRIKFFISEEGAYNNFDPPVFGSYHDVRSSYIRERLFPIACTCFLIVFGICFIFITLMFCYAVPNILSQLFTSILFLDLGIWMGGYYGIAQLCVDATHLVTVEMVALFLIVPLVTLIFASIGKHYTYSKNNIGAVSLAVVTMVFIVFHFMDIVHMNRTIPAYYVIGVIAFVANIIVMIDDVKKRNLPKAAMTQELGLFLFEVSMMLQMIVHILYKRNIINRNALTNNILPLGIMMYVYLYLLTYFLYVTEMYAQQQENESLTHLAYADGLTNLPNRSMWTKRMNELKRSDADYCVISMDLNGLKDVNDRLGHAFGDAYIADFATTMVETFPENVFVARIGGDEFVAVLDNSTPKEVESYIYDLTEKLRVQDVLDYGFRKSVAAGYAYRSELDEGDKNDPQKVYLIADKRMYDVKRHMHNSKRIGER